MTCETTKDREAEDLRAQLRTVEASLAGAQEELESLRAEHVEDQGVIAVWRRRTQEAEKRAEDAEHRLDGLREGIMSIVNKCVEMGSIAGEPPSDTSKPEPDTSADMSEPRPETVAMVRRAVGMRPLYPCSPTCTHDDARNPGHPERVKARSAGFQQGADGVWRDDYARGCDDTRAAIWEAVQQGLQEGGYTPDDVLFTRLKHFIEGAAPAESHSLTVVHYEADDGEWTLRIGSEEFSVMAERGDGDDLLARLMASKRVEIVVREAGDLVKKVDAVRKEGLS
jgi:hypothetical protein